MLWNANSSIYLDDYTEIVKQIEELNHIFEEELLNSITIPSTSIEEQLQTPESLEDLIKKCNEQINTSHSELERLKKSLAFCETRTHPDG